MSHAEPMAVTAAVGTPTPVISVRPVVLSAPGALGLGDDEWAQARADPEGDQALGRLASR